jgi:hypothetical protein
MDVSISFNPNEAQAVVNLINMAVKTHGLEVAEQALYLLKKFQTAFPPAPVVAEKEVKETKKSK